MDDLTPHEKALRTKQILKGIPKYAGKIIDARHIFKVQVIRGMVVHVGKVEDETKKTWWEKFLDNNK